VPSAVSGSHTASSRALWITVIVESLVILVGGAYNIYEVRRNSQLLQSKVNGLAEFSAAQGEKIDRMTSLIETSLKHHLDSTAPQLPGSGDHSQESENGELIKKWNALKQLKQASG